MLSKIRQLKFMSMSIFLIVIFTLSIFSVFASYDTDLKDYPKFFDKKKGFDGFFVVGEKAKGSDVIAMAIIVSGIQGYFDQKFETHKVNALDSEVSLENDIISFGSPCVNSISADIVGSNDCDFLLDENKVAVIYVRDYKGYKQLVAYGIDDEYSREISMVLREFDKYDLKGSEYYIRDADYVKLKPLAEETINELPLEEGEENTEGTDGNIEVTKGTDGNVEVTEGEGIIDTKPVAPELVDFVPECLVDLDCDDSNACSVDSCIEGVCLNSIKEEGCNYDGKCFSVGEETENMYCSNDFSMLNLKSKGSSCTADFECLNEQCVNEKCGKDGFVTRVISWFTSLFS